MCNSLLKKDAYTMISAYTKTEVSPVCKKCAIREYYGKKMTVSKRFMLDQITNRFLGIHND